MTGRPDRPESESDARTERALVHAEALERARAAESRAARALIADFIRAARDAGIAPVPLKARGYGGRGRFRTDTEGWYLRRDLSLAVGTDGNFYILTVPAGVGARLRGVTLVPSDPPLQLGRGARDGESVALDVALRRRLEAGDDYPSAGA